MGREPWLRHVALVGGLLLLVAGCRSVAVRSEPSQAYTLDVHNPRGYPMIVSWDDGGSSRRLGTVAGGDTERFIITQPTGVAIRVSATDQAGGRPVQRSVTLRAGQTVAISLGP